MTNEEFLLRLVKGTADGLGECAQSVQLDDPFSDGEACGLSFALREMQKAILLYNKKCSGKMLVELEKVD